MKKVKGKALSLVLSLALVISSFSAIPASAATKTLNGDLTGTGTDTFYFVNGENSQTNELDVDSNFGNEIAGSPVLSTDRHKQAETPKITAISHKSGDRLVKVFDNSETGKEGNIDKDTEISNIALRLRNASVSGEEVLSVLYAADYTDDNDNEYTVKASQDVTIHVYDKGQVVIGETGTTTGQGEFDGTFAQKTVTGTPDSASLVALEAIKTDGDLDVTWDPHTTAAYDKSDKDQLSNSAADYVLKSGSDNLVVADGANKNYSFGTLTGGKVPSAVPGANSYTTKTTVSDPVADAVKVTDVTDSATAKLTTAKADNDTESDWTYLYKVSAKDGAAPTLTDSTDAEAKALTLEDGLDVSADLSAVGTYKVTIAAFDATTLKGTATVTFTVALNGAVDPDNYAAFTSADGVLTVAKATNDANTAKPWTYTYKFTKTVEGNLVEVASGSTKDAGTINVPHTAGTLDIVVTAKDADSKTYETKGSIVVTAEADTPSNDVTVSVKDKAGLGSITLTAYATDTLKAAIDDESSTVSSKSNVSQKTKIEKKIKVDDPSFDKLGKYGTNTFVYSGSLDKDSESDKTAVRVNGYEVVFQDSANVTVDDKATVTKISGNASKVSVDNATVGDITLSNTVAGDVSVSDAKVGNVDFDDTQKGEVTVDSPKADVGNITSASSVRVTGGKVGTISSEDVTITPDDDDYAVTVGNISASGLVTIDSGDSKGVTTGTVTATGDDSEFDISGTNVTVDGFDYDYYAAELKLDGFSGSIPAPKNADTLVDGATISTQQSGDKVTVTGDADISSVSIADESQITFDGEVNVGSVDGSGKLIVGLGKLNVTSDASDVQLVLSDASFKVGDVAYTSTHDTIDTDSFSNYGFTVSKSENDKTDTFKIASVDFTGLTFAKSTTEIANSYSETFKATSYAPGTPIPDGYHVEYTLDGSDSTFAGVDNGDGTYTVKIVGYDTTFASENKATLTAELVDTDGATNDEYGAAEVDITALAVPTATYKSDTGSTLSIGGGFTYQFAVTSLNNVEPYFVVAGSSFKTTYVGNSGNTYYYKVKAVGKVGDAAGVYINHGAAPSTVITITNPSDTAAVTVKAGNSYQFRVNGPSQPVFQVAGIGNIALTSKAGSNYYFKVNVPTNLAKGGHGVYNNGVLVAILTVA